MPTKAKKKTQKQGKEAFQLRLWDGRIGRWLTTDPYRQYHSPYVGMGNDPINGIDPDGGFWEEFGNWLAGKGWNTNGALAFQSNGGVLGDWVGDKFTGYHKGFGDGSNGEIIIAVFRAKNDFKGNTSIYIWNKTHSKDVGHTAIKIDDYIFGFYPTDQDNNGVYDMQDLTNSPGELHIDSSNEFRKNYSNQSVNFWDLNIKKSQAQDLVSNLINIKNNPPKYSLSGMHCTSVADKCLNDSGIKIRDNPFFPVRNSTILGDAPKMFAIRINSFTNKNLIKNHGVFIVK